MPFLRNISPYHMSPAYGGFSVSLKPGETKRLRQFKHPTTGDVFDVEHMAATFRTRYPDCGLIVIDDEHMDTMTEEELEGLEEDAKEKMLDRFQSMIDDFNELNLLLAHDGKSTIRKPRSIKEIAALVKKMRGLGESGLFVSDEKLDEIRSGVTQRQAQVIEQARLLLEGGRVEEAVNLLNMKRDAAISGTEELAPGQVLEPQPSPPGRARGRASVDSGDTAA